MTLSGFTGYVGISSKTGLSSVLSIIKRKAPGGEFFDYFRQEAFSDIFGRYGNEIGEELNTDFLSKYQWLTK